MSHRKMTQDDYSSLGKEILEELSLYDPEDLDKSYDYKILTLKFNDGKTLIVYHGFPGDNPVGCIVNKEGSYLASCGEGGDEIYNKDPSLLNHINSFLKWYQTTTENTCNYKDSMFYS